MLSTRRDRGPSEMNEQDLVDTMTYVHLSRSLERDRVIERVLLALLVCARAHHTDMTRKKFLAAVETSEERKLLALEF